MVTPRGVNGLVSVAASEPFGSGADSFPAVASSNAQYHPPTGIEFRAELGAAERDRTARREQSLRKRVFSQYRDGPAASAKNSPVAGPRIEPNDRFSRFLVEPTHRHPT